jgi:hypothetical protein
MYVCLNICVDVCVDVCMCVCAWCVMQVGIYVLFMLLRCQISLADDDDLESARYALKGPT